MKRSFVWPVIITISAAAISLVAATGSQSPLRAVLGFWFLLVCPGMAYVPLLSIRNWVIELTLAVMGSAVLGTLVAEAMIYRRGWSPERGLYILIGISLIGVALQIWRALVEPGTQHKEGLAGS